MPTADKSEATILREIMLALSDEGHYVERVNVGLFYTRDGRPVRTGLPNGRSDLSGFTSGLAPFFIECKTRTGRPSPQQLQFLQAMRDRGALAGIARSVDDALAIIASPKV